MANLEHQRAEYAWEKSRIGLEVGGDDYKNLCKAAPALIMNNGLMQTLAFYADKNKNHHKELNQQLMTWLCTRFPEQINDPNFDQVMANLYKSGSSFYRQATGETLALLRWLRQFASVQRGGRGGE